MDKRDVLIFIIDNDLMFETPFVVEYNAQFFCKVEMRTCYLCPKSLIL